MKKWDQSHGVGIEAAGEMMVKKPNPVYMVQATEEAQVETTEGTMHASEGDWIVYDPLSGHVWPITDEYRTLHYNPSDSRGMVQIPDEPNHYVTFDDNGWFIEHSVACRIAGTLGTCEFNQAVRTFTEDIGRIVTGRWLIAGVDSAGMPILQNP